MSLYVGIDLHSNNNFLGIIDDNDQRIFNKKLPNDIDNILLSLEPYKKRISGVVVESTFNWYWLVDGLMEKGYKVHLANPSAIKQYEGLKHTDDKWDSFWLGHMLRLKILPEGYIYPKDERPIRDLLRRRILFVQHRTAIILSLQSMVNRNLGYKISGSDIYKLKENDSSKLFTHPQLIFAAKEKISMIRYLTEVTRRIEKEVLSKVKLKNEYKKLLTIPGVGKILASTIMFEVGNILRFPKVNNYSSYCRCVKSERLSNGKTKGKGNRKNGNKYLGWAYVEAANFATRYCPSAQRFYQRKKTKTNRILAIKALSNKLARASYFIMKDNMPYDVNKLFTI